MPTLPLHLSKKYVHLSKKTHDQLEKITLFLEFSNQVMLVNSGVAALLSEDMVC